MMSIVTSVEKRTVWCKKLHLMTEIKLLLRKCVCGCQVIGVNKLISPLGNVCYIYHVG